MRSCGPNANNSVAALSTSPQSISFFEDSKERLTLKDFKEELSRTFESITGSHDLLEPQESQAGLIADVFSRLHMDPEELTRYTHHDESKHYTRNLVATDNAHYTLLLLCWNPGKSSPIHDHPCDGCWMQVLKGQVRECRYERTKDAVLKCFSDETFYEGQQLYINDSLGYHKVENPSLTQPAITLHLYCPPFDKCRIWMDPTRKSSNSKMTYHSQYGCLTSNAQPEPRS